MKPLSYLIGTLAGNRLVSRSPVLTALVLLLTVRPCYGNRISGSRVRRRIFFLPKTLFREDLVNVIKEDDPEFELWYIAREPLKRLANAYLPKDLSEYNYTTINADVTSRKDLLRLHWERTLRIFKKVLDPAAFVTCAYYYREEREFAAACVANGVPFVALHKECITAPITRVARQEVYGKMSGKFTGSLITTYNEDEKSTIVTSGCADPDLVDVVGCPRMDHLFGNRQGTTAIGFDVVFFSFSPTTYLPVYRKVPRWPATIEGISIRPWDWSQLYRRYHCFAIEFARNHPELKIALKVKTGFSLVDVIAGDVQRGLGLPSNLTLISGGEGGSLAAVANVACGFNSTILLEALAARTPVVVPAFAEAEPGSVPESYGTLRLGSAVDYARSEEDLDRILNDKSRRKPNRQRAFTKHEREALERYVGFVDGRSGERMRRSIARALGLPRAKVHGSAMEPADSIGVPQCR